MELSKEFITWYASTVIDLIRKYGHSAIINEYNTSDNWRRLYIKKYKLAKEIVLQLVEEVKQFESVTMEIKVDYNFEVCIFFLATTNEHIIRSSEKSIEIFLDNYCDSEHFFKSHYTQIKGNLDISGTTNRVRATPFGYEVTLLSKRKKDINLDLVITNNSLFIIQKYPIMKEDKNFVQKCHCIYTDKESEYLLKKLELLLKD